MTSKDAKREARKKAERMSARAAATERRRISKADYLLYEGLRREFKKGGSAHDVFFHLAMKNKVFAARFLDAYLPQKLRNAIQLDDHGKIRVIPTDFYDARVKKHVADFVFVVPCKEKNRYVALTVIIEHKAQSGTVVDRRTIMQTLKYVVLQVESELQDVHGAEIVYQPIVVVIYTGSDPNFEAPSWEDCFALPESLQGEELGSAQIRFKPICVNLTRLFLEDKLDSRDFLRVVPEVMARASLKRLSESYPTLFRPLNAVKEWTTDKTEMLEACANYVAVTSEKELDEKEYEQLSQSVDNKQMRDKIDSFFGILIDKGKAEGERKGKREGKREGKVEGKRDGKFEIYQDIIDLKFPETAPRIQDAVSKKDDFDFAPRIVEELFNAQTVEEVGVILRSHIRPKPRRRRQVSRA